VALFQILTEREEEFEKEKTEYEVVIKEASAVTDNDDEFLKVKNEEVTKAMKIFQKN